MQSNNLLRNAAFSLLLFIIVSAIPLPRCSNNYPPLTEYELSGNISLNDFLLSELALLSKSQSTNGNLSEIDPMVLEEFVDDFFSNQTLAQFQAPGVVVTFVRDTEILLSKGYGWANISAEEIINPNTTVFRAGSISKSFVATAVMQLYEQGLLNLSADINDYLPTLTINDTYPDQPITMSHLLTHTAGFDEVWNVSFEADSELITLPDFLRSNVPLRIFPPGEATTYSNYGYALAGYIVELIAGVPFSQYVNTSILDPLGMNSSGFEQPFSPKSFTNFAQGYVISNESEFEPMDLYYFSPYPAGSFYTTGRDISKFMLAHLNNGTYNNQSILNETTIHFMHEKQFSHHPQLEGFCYGFYEYFANDIRAIHHAGDLYGFASELMLFPDYNFGYFISQNSVGNGLRDYFTAVFVNEFLPGEYSSPVSTSDFKDRMHLYTGTYWHTRYPHELYEQYKESIPFSSIDLLVNEYLNLLLTNITQFGQSYLIEWVEIEPFLFQYSGRDTKLLLYPENEEIKYIFFGLSAYERHLDEVPPTSISPTSNTSLTTEISETATTDTSTSTSTDFGFFYLLLGLSILLIKRKRRRNFEGNS